MLELRQRPVRQKTTALGKADFFRHGQALTLTAFANQIFGFHNEEIPWSTANWDILARVCP